MAAMANAADKGTLSRAEWLWVGLCAMAIMALTSLPYLLGAALSTPDNQFGAFVIGVEDGNSYLAKMRQGATDGWRFYLSYTSEPHDGAYLYLFYLLLGKIAQLSGLSLGVGYHLARVACGIALLVTAYCFAAFFTHLRPVRRLAFWLVGLGSGLGWLAVLLGLANRWGMPLDFYSPDAFAFHFLFGLPHLALAEALLLWAILCLLVAWERQQVSYALLAGLALTGMAIIAPFYLVIVAAAVGAGWLLRRWQAAQRPDYAWTEAGLAILALAIAAPVLLYHAYLYVTNPILRIWAEQDRILSPAPVHYLLAFGLLALLAVIGGWEEWGRGSLRSRLLIGWCAVVPLLVYVPFNLQRRLMLGVHVPLSVLAALGLWRLFTAENGLRRWRVVSAGLVALLSVSNWLILTGAVLEVSRQSAPLFHSGAEVNAADWLGAHVTPDQVVLAAYETGNYLPTRMSARVFAGHSSETIDSQAKRATLRQFFANDVESSEATDDFRRRVLQDHRVAYVFYGPAERALGSFSPAQAPYLQKVYDNGDIQIYRVVDEGHD
jgi:hypothetical protein